MCSNTREDDLFIQKILLSVVFGSIVVVVYSLVSYEEAKNTHIPHNISIREAPSLKPESHITQNISEEMNDATLNNISGEHYNGTDII